MRKETGLMRGVGDPRGPQIATPHPPPRSALTSGRPWPAAPMSPLLGEPDPLSPKVTKSKGARLGSQSPMSAPGNQPGRCVHTRHPDNT